MNEQAIDLKIKEKNHAAIIQSNSVVVTVIVKGARDARIQGYAHPAEGRRKGSSEAERNEVTAVRRPVSELFFALHISFVARLAAGSFLRRQLTKVHVREISANCRFLSEEVVALSKFKFRNRAEKVLKRSNTIDSHARINSFSRDTIIFTFSNLDSAPVFPFSK